MLKTYNIDKIVASLTKTVKALEDAQQRNTLLADVAQADIEDAVARRDTFAAEAKRAEKIASNVKKLLDIS